MCHRQICRVVLSVFVIPCISCVLWRWLVCFYICCLRRDMRLISVVIQGWWKRVVVSLLGTCCSCKSMRLDLMLCHIV